MKTVADFKRLLYVGLKLQAIYHQASAGWDEKRELLLKDLDMGVREVSIVQSNSFALKTAKNGSFVDSWMNYPKASEAVISDNKIVIMSEDFRVRGDARPLIPCVTYIVI